MKKETKVESYSLIYWILDHRHFLLFSFFTQDELENTLVWISHRFKEKVMSIIFWRDMMNSISGNLTLENEESVISEEENTELEKEKLNDLLQSCHIEDNDYKKESEVTEQVNDHITCNRS